LFKGPAVPTDRIHDFHPPTAASGLYWVVPVPKEALKVSEDGRTLMLQMKNVEVADQPLWPAFHAAMQPAILSFRLVLTATEEKIAWDVAERQFRFDGYKAKAQLEASVEVPFLKYSWKSEGLEKSKADFAILGKEANGKFYPR
jgi:hypothetical protein